MSKATEFQLPESLTITQAENLHDQFEHLIDEATCDQLIVHGANVSRTDTAGMQLLLALLEAAREKQINFVWDKPSDKLIAGAEILGLKQSLGLH